MRLIQVTIAVTGTRQQLSPNLNGFKQANQVYASVLIIQNNGANNMRIGDNTVSSTKGIVLFPSGGSMTTQPLILRGTMLAQWYIEGTAGDVADILYETSN